jgi:hypothetical protein
MKSKRFRQRAAHEVFAAVYKQFYVYSCRKSRKILVVLTNFLAGQWSRETTEFGTRREATKHTVIPTYVPLGRDLNPERAVHTNVRPTLHVKTSFIFCGGEAKPVGSTQPAGHWRWKRNYFERPVLVTKLIFDLSRTFLYHRLQN